MCAGCGAPPVVRAILRGLHPEDHAVISSATGCLEVCTYIYPYTAWEDSFVHTAFENSAATLSGAEAAYEAMKRKGTLPTDKDVKFIAFGGDGGTYDIGFQSLSGAMERGHDMTYFCYDNEAYMNTGVQRSSATPKYADTSTTPAGKVRPGKLQYRKDLTRVMAEHHLPYVAQTACYRDFSDITKKAEKAIYTKGPCFVNCLAPCPTGWKYKSEDLMLLNKLAVETRFWPLYEVENGKYTINYIPKEHVPVSEFLKLQKRFSHLFKPGNEHLIEEIQADVDARWEELLKLAEMSNK
jgi:pyruvate ferredoxin oxidoreductase beta subunit